MGKIKLVVINENTLGYIMPEIPNCVDVFRAKITIPNSSRFTSNGGCQILYNSDNIRLANKKDFDYFDVSFAKAYENNNEYEYDKGE